MADEQISNKVSRKRKELSECVVVLNEIIRVHLENTLLIHTLLAVIYDRRHKNKRTCVRGRFTLLERIPDQICHINRLVGITDRSCIDNLRMDRNTFGRLCRLLRDNCGLIDQKFITVEQQVAMFLCILSHHKKTRVVGFDFFRSSQTVSHYVHVILRAVLKLHGILFVKPEPIGDDCCDSRWKWFKGCLGALDGTHINVRVPAGDAPRYRNRKGPITTNTLAVCDRFLRFTYVLPGWEGSAGDSWILHDSVSRPHGIKVPKGFYYLCDNGYANSDGFLTPYKGVRYHLKEWGPGCQAPQTPHELFNLRHTKARNVIERAFAVLKMRWRILRSASFYPIDVQTWLILACFLLHNFIRSQMEVDPVEEQMEFNEEEVNDGDHGDESPEYVAHVEPINSWNQKREDLAASMWADFNMS